MRQMVLVLSRQQPFLVLFLVLCTLSGIAFWVGDEAPDLPGWLAQAWASALFVTGLAGLAGIAWQRWHLVRGKMLLRGILMVQAGAVLVYSGLIGLYLPTDVWAVVLVFGAVWVAVCLWESRLLAKELGAVGEAAGEH